MMGYPQNSYYTPFPMASQNFYHPSAPAYAQMQMYQPQQNYMLSQQQQHQPQQPQLQPPAEIQESAAAAAPSGMVAHESNGMVFYLPASEASQHNTQAGGDYQPAESFVPSYAMPGLLPPTPGPEPGARGFFYPSGQVGGFYTGGQ
jgi:hypothetical protein